MSNYVAIFVAGFAAGFCFLAILLTIKRKD